MREREHDGFIVLPEAPPLVPELRIGGRVRICKGPLIGLKGLYAGMRGRERVKVLLQILGSSERSTSRLVTSRRFRRHEGSGFRIRVSHACRMDLPRRVVSA